MNQSDLIQANNRLATLVQSTCQVTVSSDGQSTLIIPESINEYNWRELTVKITPECVYVSNEDDYESLSLRDQIETSTFVEFPKRFYDTDSFFKVLELDSTALFSIDEILTRTTHEDSGTEINEDELTSFLVILDKLGYSVEHVLFELCKMSEEELVTIFSYSTSDERIEAFRHEIIPYYSSIDYEDEED